MHTRQLVLLVTAAGPDNPHIHHRLPHHHHHSLHHRLQLHSTGHFSTCKFRRLNKFKLIYN